jgi:hypothetical protein
MPVRWLLRAGRSTALPIGEATARSRREWSVDVSTQLSLLVQDRHVVAAEVDRPNHLKGAA